MRIKKSTINHISEESLQEFVLNYVPLEKQRQSGNNLIGCCPSVEHDDQNPSFSIRNDNTFKCFSCGFGGKGIITFVMKLKGIGFKEAVEEISGLMGGQVEYEFDSKKVYPQNSHQNDNKGDRDLIEVIKEFHQTLDKFKVAAIDRDQKAHKNTPEIFYVITKKTEDFIKQYLAASQNEILVQAGLLASGQGELRAFITESLLLPVKNNRNEIITYVCINQQDYIKDPLCAKEKLVDNIVTTNQTFFYNMSNVTTLNRQKNQIPDMDDVVFISQNCLQTHNLLEQGINAVNLLGSHQHTNQHISFHLLNKKKIIVIPIPSKYRTMPSARILMSCLQWANAYVYAFSKTCFLNPEKYSEKHSEKYLEKRSEKHLGIELEKLEYLEGVHLFFLRPDETLSSIIPTLLQGKKELSHEDIKKIFSVSRSQGLLDYLNQHFQTVCEIQKKQNNSQLIQRIEDNSVVGSMVMGHKLKERLAICLSVDHKIPDILIDRPKKRRAIDKVLENDEENCSHDLLAVKSDNFSHHFSQNLSHNLSQEIPLKSDYKLLNKVAFYFNLSLLSDQDAEAASFYVKKRGISDEIIKRFQVGYANGTILMNLFRDDEYCQQVAERLGLLKGKENELYDVFRDRIIFPIRDEYGIVVGFGGRVINNNHQAPKYINSCESQAYKKREILYGLYEAKISNHTNNKYSSLNVVEGYIDVLNMHNIGLTNTVSPCGTALTNSQIKQLFNETKHLNLIFDGDQAGQKATKRTIELLLTQLDMNQTVTFVSLPIGQDPSEMIEKQQTDQLKTCIKSGKPLEKKLYEFATDYLDVKSIDGKFRFLERVKFYLNQCQNDKLERKLIGSLSKQSGIEQIIIQQYLHADSSFKKKLKSQMKKK